MEPNLRSAWLKMMATADCEPEVNTFVCSDHFLAEVLYLTVCGLNRVRGDAVPITNVKVSRICLTTNYSLYPTADHGSLRKAYQTLTGLKITLEALKSDENLNSSRPNLMVTHIEPNHFDFHIINRDVENENRKQTPEGQGPWVCNHPRTL